MMKITGLSHLFKWENLHNWWLTKYFFAPLYIYIICVHSLFIYCLLVCLLMLRLQHSGLCKIPKNKMKKRL